MYTAAERRRACKLERDSGPCDDYHAVWYFEPVRRQCRRFLYGGCHGNANRFSTERECRALCDVTAVGDDVTASATTTTEVTWSVTWPQQHDNHERQADDSVPDVYGMCSPLMHRYCKVLCMSVCLSVCPRAYISETTRPNFSKLSIHVACGRGSYVSVLLSVQGLIGLRFIKFKALKLQQ